MVGQKKEGEEERGKRKKENSIAEIFAELSAFLYENSNPLRANPA